MALRCAPSLGLINWGRRFRQRSFAVASRATSVSLLASGLSDEPTSGVGTPERDSCMSTNQNSGNPLSEGLAELAEQLRASVVQVHEGGRGIGAGIIWRVEPAGADGEADAIIVTNAHVVGALGGATLGLRLADQRAVQGTLIAVDSEHDLAALRVRASALHPARLGDSTKLRVGELVLAVGHPFGRVGALTLGVVAARAPADPALRLEPVEPTRDALKRPAADGSTPAERERRQGFDFIQADIRLYPANSGGPL